MLSERAADYIAQRLQRSASRPFLWKNTYCCAANSILMYVQAPFLSRLCMFCGVGKSLASLRRLWAAATRWNSSFEPHALPGRIMVSPCFRDGPRKPSRPRPRIRLRWEKSISASWSLTFAPFSSAKTDLQRRYQPQNMECVPFTFVPLAREKLR